MAKSPNALELLRRDHREVLQMLRQFERTDDTRQQQALCREIVDELDKHAAIEEDVFYPYVRDTSDRLELIEEAFIEHDSTKELMDELRAEDAGSPRFQALMKVLGEYVALHVREEEERIFPLVEKMGIDLDALGEELAERRGNGDGRDRGRHAGERRGPNPMPARYTPAIMPARNTASTTRVLPRRSTRRCTRPATITETRPTPPATTSDT